MLPGSTFAVVLGAAALLLARCSDSEQPSAAAVPPPPLMLPSNAGWAGGFNQVPPPEDYIPEDYLNNPEYRERALSLGAPPNKVTEYLAARSLNEFIPPASGIGPISDGPDYPFYNNPMRVVVGRNSTYRVADLTSEAAKNLMPWAIEALKAQNALTMAGLNGETRQARCWETGVPDIHEAPQALYFIQTPEKIVMYQGGRVRHIYMNVPHSENPTPSWYGESVGHYEGDTLVIDTIGLNTRTFVDGFRTPHTTQLHVVERFMIVNDGKTLDVSWTANDPGLAYQPWGGRRPRYRVNARMAESTCQEANDDRFNLGLDPTPRAETPDF